MDATVNRQHGDVEISKVELKMKEHILLGGDKFLVRNFLSISEE